jgi:chorismate dehydratase
VPLDEITSVRLDDHSRTSNVLLQILAQRLWLKDWEFYFNTEQEDATSCLMIGDKVFENKSHYPYQYDLATAWKALTGLPMVFAVWITKPGIPSEIIEQLNLAFENGMESIRNGTSGLESWQTDYLLHHISYPLNKAKREAMKLYLAWAEPIMALPNVR